MIYIQLKINDNVYDRFLWLLSKFNKEEVEIISDDSDFISTQKYLQNELRDIDSDKAVFYSQIEMEARLDKTIDKHEDNL